MKRKLGSLILIGFFLLSGCINSADYKDDDVAAIVRGEEITVGYLRFLYPDEAIVEMIDEVVKAKLAEQQVKKMNIDVSAEKKEIEANFSKYPPEEVNTAEAQSIRAFSDSKAKELAIDPEEFYEKYIELSVDMTAYTNIYTSYVLGEMEDEYGIEEYVHHANEVLDNLVDMHEEQIEILIK